MKNVLFVLAVLFLCQCTNKSTHTNDDKSSNFDNLSIRVSPATLEAYNLLIAKEKERHPIARLCAESKGYRLDEWDALNECSWAVEKHQMNRHANIINRSGGELTFNLSDSSYVLTHKADEYYQFVNYLPKSKHIVIRVLRPLACPEYWLFNSKNGQKKVLQGQPIFSSDGQSFLLTTSTKNSKIKCSKSISYWALQEGEFQYITSSKKSVDVQGLMWNSGNTWLGKQQDKFVQIEL